jgi:hypothetical protein
MGVRDMGVRDAAAGHVNINRYPCKHHITLPCLLLHTVSSEWKGMRVHVYVSIMCGCLANSSGRGVHVI